MKKKLISFVLTICLFIPAMIFVGCGRSNQSEVDDSRIWYDIGNYKMTFEGVEYTGHSVYVFVEVKNPNSYETTLSTNAFTLDSYKVLSFGVQNSSGNWVDYDSIDFNAKASTLVKIVFYGPGNDYSTIYSLNYLGNKIADVSSTQVIVTVNN